MEGFVSRALAPLNLPVWCVRGSQWVRLNLEKDRAPGNENMAGTEPPGAEVPRGPGFGPRVIG